MAVRTIKVPVERVARAIVIARGHPVFQLTLEELRSSRSQFATLIHSLTDPPKLAHRSIGFAADLDEPKP
jgi:hypothetical protein